MASDETTVFDFASRLAAMGHPTTELFERTAAHFGRETVMELVAVCGSAAFLPTIINVTGMLLTKD